MSATTTLFGTIPAVIGRPGFPINGTDEGEWIFGTEADDIIVAGGGDDFIQAFAGANTIVAGDGNDTVLGGTGDDTIEGGPGDDVMSGGGGANEFAFDPSRAEGDDVIVDFTPENLDKISLSAAGLSRVGIDEFSGAALDEDEAFNIVEDENGDQVIEHPGGTITLFGVPFPEAEEEAPTFAGLEAAGLLTTSGLITATTDEGEELLGSEGDDVIIGGAGDDTITPGGGNDIITLGGGRDTVNIDPTTPGNVVITDFSAPSALDPTAGDFINFASEDVLAADPDLPAADGDPTSLSLADFDASANWTVGASEGGSLLLTHPNGSVELGNVAFANQTFESLSSIITIDGAEVTGPIPVDGEPVPPDGEPVPPDGEPAPPDGEPAPPDGEPTPPDGEPDVVNGEPAPVDDETDVVDEDGLDGGDEFAAANSSADGFFVEDAIA